MKNKKLLFILSAFFFQSFLFSQTNIENEMKKRLKESKLVSFYSIAPDATSARIKWLLTTNGLFDFPRMVYAIERTKKSKTGVILETKTIGSVKMLSTNTAWQPVIKKDSVALLLQRKTVFLLDDKKNPPFLTKSEIAEIYKKEGDATGAVIANMILQRDEEKTKNMSEKEKDEVDYNNFIEAIILEQNFEVAKNMGFAYEDTTIEKGFTYEYRVIPSMAFKSSNSLRVEYKEKETIKEEVKTNGKQVYLSWLAAQDISYYNVLRSKVPKEGDSTKINYTKVNERPIVNLNEGANARIQNVDSLSTHGKYNYKILGYDTFGYAIGNYGPFQVNLLPFIGSPEIDEASIQSDNEVDLRWKFNVQEDQQYIKEYIVTHSKDAEGKDSRILEVFEGDLNYKKLKFDIEPINYLQLVAKDIKDELHYSEMVMVQPIDSIAPLKPIFVNGVIDSVGVVTLNWKPNELDTDVTSYHVFRSNIKDGTFGQISGSAVELTNFKDTIVTSVSNKAVYYKLIAMDKRQNQSDFSEMIEIKRPDVFPPSPAVLSEWEIVDGENIQLNWINSSSEDLAYSVIYRAGTDEITPNWKEVIKTNVADKLTSFIDTTTQRKNEYYYTMVAVDSVGLESKLTSPLHVIIPRGIIKLKPVNKFKVTESLGGDKLTVEWKYKPTYNEDDEKFSFELYKENEQKEFVKKATIAFPINQVVLSPSHIGEKATYYLKVVNNYGDESKLIKQK